MINILRSRNLKNRRSRVRHRIFMNIAHRIVRWNAREGSVMIVEEYLGDYSVYRTYVLED